MLAVAIPVGLAIGLALGALGGGGSILAVPALVYLLDQPPHAATTGSLLVVGATALAGAVAHARAGRVRIGQGLTFGGLGVAGSYVGARLSASVDPHVLLSGFAVLMLVAAGAMLRRARARSGGNGEGHAPRELAGTFHADDVVDPAPPARARTGASGVVVLDRHVAAATTCRLPSPTLRFTTCRAIKVIAAATVVGLLTGFFGVGGGFVIVPALVLALGFELPVAVGTSLLVIAVNSAAALAVRLGDHAQLDWRLLGLFAMAAIVGSLTGNRVASRVDEAKLTVAFTVLLIAVAAYTAARSVPYLV